MSAERFIIDEKNEDNNLIKLVDKTYDCFYFINDTERNVEIFCEKLNSLAEENERLRQELAETLSLHSNWIIRKDMYEEELIKENEQLKKELDRQRNEKKLLREMHYKLCKENIALRLLRDGK